MTSHLLRKYFCKGSSVLKQHFSRCQSLWNQVTLSPYKGAHLRKKACSGKKGETQMSLDQTECSVKYEASPALNGASKTHSLSKQTFRNSIEWVFPLAGEEVHPLVLIESRPQTISFICCLLNARPWVTQDLTKGQHLFMRNHLM